MNRQFSKSVSRLLTEAGAEMRMIPAYLKQLSDGVEEASRQLALFPAGVTGAPARFRSLAHKFARTRLGRCVREWEGATELDPTILLVALACDSTGVSLNWNGVFSVIIDDPIERLAALARVNALSTHVYTFRCALKDETLTELLQMGKSAAARGQYFEVRDPRVTFDQLVVEPEVRGKLLRLAQRLTASSNVLEDWGLGAAHRSATGGGALFYGPPGTGKTLAAEALAGEMGLGLFILDTTRIHDMYVGQTERHLADAFKEAARRHVLLFIDEADGLLGQRTGVNYSTDAYRNNKIETLLLLIERRTGPTILASNFDDVLDPALRRRLSTRIEFPRPTEPVRRRLWELHIPSSVPVEETIDLDRLARLQLSGGEISQAVMMAACHAASENRGLNTKDLLDAAEPWVTSERKIGFQAGLK